MYLYNGTLTLKTTIIIYRSCSLLLDLLYPYVFILTHSNKTNSKLFQTESVCRRHIQIWWKMQKVLEVGGRHCGKRRNCSLRVIYLFPTVFSWDYYLQTRINQGLFRKGLFLIQNSTFCRSWTFKSKSKILRSLFNNFQDNRVFWRTLRQRLLKMHTLNQREL